VNKVLEDWKPPFAHRAAIIKALTTLNEKGASVIDRPTGEQAVKDILRQYNADITRQFDAAGPGVISPPTTQHLSWEIGQLYAKGWLIWGTLTLISGMSVLILTNPGFGTALDFVFCFFWGFGLPTGIDKLQQLSPTGIATTIGMSQFKSAP
jgi:hypothetical protein